MSDEGADPPREDGRSTRGGLGSLSEAWRGLGKRDKRRVTVVLTIVVVAASFGVGVAGTQYVKSREVYERALSAARQSPELRQAIGSPIKDGLYAGEYGWEGSSGTGEQVEATLYVSGPKGSATIYAQGRKDAGEGWDYYDPLAVVDGSGRRIYLEDPG